MDIKSPKEDEQTERPLAEPVIDIIQDNDYGIEVDLDDVHSILCRARTNADRSYRRIHEEADTYHYSDREKESETRSSADGQRTVKLSYQRAENKTFDDLLALIPEDPEEKLAMLPAYQNHDLIGRNLAMSLARMPEFVIRAMNVVSHNSIAEKVLAREMMWHSTNGELPQYWYMDLESFGSAAAHRFARFVPVEDMEADHMVKAIDLVGADHIEILRSSAVNSSSCERLLNNIAHVLGAETLKDLWLGGKIDVASQRGRYMYEFLAEKGLVDKLDRETVEHLLDDDLESEDVDIEKVNTAISFAQEDRVFELIRKHGQRLSLNLQYQLARKLFDPWDSEVPAEKKQLMVDCVGMFTCYEAHRLIGECLTRWDDIALTSKALEIAESGSYIEGVLIVLMINSDNEESLAKAYEKVKDRDEPYVEELKIALLAAHVRGRVLDRFDDWIQQGVIWDDDSRF